MSTSDDAYAFYDFAPGEESFRAAVFDGLSQPPRSLPCKFLYDARGSELFEAICRLPEYYPTRTETAILDGNAAAIAARMGPHARLIEFGSGASRKVRTLLEKLVAPAAYVAIDISREALREAASGLAADFPDLDVIAVCADYTRPVTLPPLAGPQGKRVGFFPGSTIGNFEPREAAAFIANCGRIIGAGGELLIGVDLKKDPAILNAAYDDAAGVTAAFNLNLLARINRELDGDLDLDRFAHVAFFNPVAGRMELYIESRADQETRIAGRRFRFAKGERIHTEYSYKYALDEFQDLAGKAGFDPVDAWCDPARLFSVHYLRRR